MKSKRQSVPTVTREQMALVDKLAIEEFGMDLFMMMENAGRAMATLVRERVNSGKKIGVLAGKGNNAGGVLCAARHLHNWGYEPEIILGESRQNLKKAPATQLKVIECGGVSIKQWHDDMALDRFDALIDGLLGYNARGTPRYPLDGIIMSATASRSTIISLDLPSGMDPDTGIAENPTLKADYTLTLALPKIGLMQEHARGWIGELAVADIGIPVGVFESAGIEGIRDSNIFDGELFTVIDP